VCGFLDSRPPKLQPFPWSFFCHKNIGVLETRNIHTLKTLSSGRGCSPTATHTYTYLLTPWSRVLLEKLTGFQLVKKIPAFYGTRKFITAVTSARQLSLSWASSIQAMPLHPTSWRPILILPSHLRLGLPRHTFTALYFKPLCFYSINLIN